MKDSFYEKLERVFDKFLKHRKKMLLGDFNVEVGGEDIFKPTIGNENFIQNFIQPPSLKVKSIYR
jgi:exonuclease III